MQSFFRNMFALTDEAWTVPLSFTKRPCVVDWRPTLEGAGRLLSQSEVLLRQMVDRLVLVDLHTGAYVALTM